MATPSEAPATALHVVTPDERPRCPIRPCQGLEELRDMLRAQAESLTHIAEAVDMLLRRTP